MKIESAVYNLDKQKLVNTFHNKEIEQKLSTEVQSQKLKVLDLEEPINVTISEEGKEKFKQNVSLNQAIERGNADKLDNSITYDYGWELSGRSNVLAKEMMVRLQGNRELTVKERAECILSSYAQMYDEILQGYKDGSREMYVIDENCDGGRRKLTQEEELKRLDDTYKKIALTYEKQVQNDRKLTEGMKKVWEDVVISRNMRSDTIQKGLGEIEDKNRKLEEVIPENMSEKLLKAANSFSIQYNGIKNSNILTEILSGIEIW